MALNDIEKTEAIIKQLSDKYWRLNNLYFIKDKNGEKVKFKFNWAQEIYHKTKHNRNIILKARQLGFTTYKCIDKLDHVLFNSYVDAGIICHNLEDAEKIFNNKVKFAFDNLPDWLKNIRKPSNDRAGELRFPNGSSISVSAGFRGGTLAGGLHVSEYGKLCAKYPEKAREVKTGALNAVPLMGDADFESTAEGMSGDFYEMCQVAQSKDVETLTPLDFKLHFYPWYKAEEYQLNPIGIVIPQELIAYFNYLEKEHDIILTDDQRAWYVKKSEEQGEDMHREYPSYPEEAFLASGRPFFNQEQITKEINRVKKLQYTIKYFIVKSHSEKEFTVPVKIYREPLKDMAYAVAGDPAEGLEHGDNSALSVLNRNMDQVAFYAGKLDPDLFGALMVEVAKHYNQAIVAPEVNNHGHAVIAAIKMRKYYKFFKRETKEEIGKDIQDRVGWLNTVKSKMELLDDLKKSFRDGSLGVNDEATLREMLICVYEEDGNVILNGKDRVVALGISIQAIKQALLDKEYKASSPVKETKKDVTKMKTEDRIAYYKRRHKQ